MNHNFYLHMAKDTIIKNKKLYIPFMLSCVLCITMCMMLATLLDPNIVSKIDKGGVIEELLSLGKIIVCIFSIIYLFYTSCVLLKTRMKELGLYFVLGMDKKHISKLLKYEYFMISIITIGISCILSVLCGKVLFLLILHILAQPIQFGFVISKSALMEMCIFYIIVFFLLYLYAVININRMNPIQLLNRYRMHEKEPKTKIIRTIIGMVCLVVGYGIALSIDNPLTSLLMFFVAVLLVIIATYLLFSAGSIILFKLLRKNKRYYYQFHHFINVSNMLHRMNHNANSLASICLLSTMILVVASSTTSLWLGNEDILNKRVPRDIVIETRNQQEILKIDNYLKQQHIEIKKPIKYQSLSFTAYQKNDGYTIDTSNLSTVDLLNMETLVIMPLSDFNTIENKNYTLSNDDEVYIYSSKKRYEKSNFTFMNQKYAVKDEITSMQENGNISAEITNSIYVIVKDEKVLEKFYQIQSNYYKQYRSNSKYYYAFDTNHQTIYEDLLKLQLNATIESKSMLRNDMLSLYGGLFFIGIYISILFLAMLVFIMYYKQINEGYQDQQRYKIMQKIGLEKHDVKKIITSQVKTIFYLPLCFSFLHICFAFPFIVKILKVFLLDNVTFTFQVFVGNCTIFAVTYILIYLMSAKTYYKILAVS